MSANVTVRKVFTVIKRPAFWLIVASIMLITFLHYQELETPLGIYDWSTRIGLTRHAFDRILYLAPIALAGFSFGWVGGITVSLLALVAMLPRALMISTAPVDSLLETCSVFIIGNVLAMTFYTLKKERRYHHELEEAHERMRFYLGEVNNAQEEERKRISHELHDDTIQALVVLSRQLDTLATTGEGITDECRQRLEKLRQDTNNIMTGIRRLSQDLRPAALERLGLVAAIESLAGEIGRDSGISVKLNVKGDIARLSEEKELVIFRIVQEALRNVWRHSGATMATVEMESDDKTLAISVTDNGKGFKLPHNINEFPSGGKLGIAGMQERSQLISADLQIESKPGQGTKITLRADTLS